MRKRNHAAARRVLILMAGIPCAVFLLAATLAHAQGPGRAEGMTPEQLKAAWALEAKHVAGKLKLEEDATGKLVKTYTDAQTAYADAITKKREEMRSEGGERGGARGATRTVFEEVRKAESDKWATALAEFLTEEQVKVATTQLGGFSNTLDRMVHILARFELGDKQGKAVDRVFTYNLEQGKLWTPGTGGSQDFTALREKMAALKTKLDADLAELLSEEQLETWKEATTFRGRGAGGRGQVGRGQGGRGQGPRREE